MLQLNNYDICMYSATNCRLIIEFVIFFTVILRTCGKINELIDHHSYVSVVTGITTVKETTINGRKF